jgi:hypothetical protein
MPSCQRWRSGWTTSGQSWAPRCLVDRAVSCGTCAEPRDPWTSHQADHLRGICSSSSSPSLRTLGISSRLASS